MNSREWPERVRREVKRLSAAYAGRLDRTTISEILFYTTRKCAIAGKGADYIPILFENEMDDYLMRQEINRKGARNHGLLSQNPRAAARPA